MKVSGRRLFGVVAVVINAALVAGLAMPSDAAPARDSATCKRRCTDTVAPSVAVLAPATGSTATGRVDVTGTASDNVSVAGVAIQVDGGSWIAASGTTSWTVSIDTRAYADGEHTIAARATDTAGNSSLTSVTVGVVNTTVDANPPKVTIISPSPGATVSGTVEVSGTAADDRTVAAVAVSLDGGEWRAASGTSSWQYSFDARALTVGSHVVTARATDMSGNATSASVSAYVAASSPDDVVVSDPNARNGLELLGRTRLPTWGTITGVLATESFTNRKVAWFRDATSGETSTIELPTDSSHGWSELASVMSSSSDLWLSGAGGGLVVRHYRLSGSPLPTSAQLVESRTFGDPDSRQGDLLALTSGAVVAAWHQQGANGLPQGQHVAYRGAGAWQMVPPLRFMPTRSSDQVLGQHPADASVWLFSNPDAWGAVGAAHLTEADGVLRVDWVDGQLLSDEEHGLFGPHGENASLAVAADRSTNTLALAYQSADARTFTDGNRVLVGARVAVARLSADGSPTFTAAPVWAERVSAVGLMIVGGETVVSYRPVAEATMSYDELFSNRSRSGAWEPGVRVGNVGAGHAVVGYGTSRAEVVAKFDDGAIHLRTV